MNQPREDCRAFRLQLELALEGRARPHELGPLGWHEHLLGCADCRELLEREEALEELLAALPEPRLSIERRLSLLARLRADSRGDSALDQLLESDHELAAPPGLAQRVLAGVQDARLDALLELNRELEVPAGLAARVLEGLEADRAPAPRFVFDRRWAWPAAAAAAAAIFFAWPRGEEPAQPDFVEGPKPVVVPVDEPPAPEDTQPVEVAVDEPLTEAEEDDLLAVLDLLEEDALWSDESLDLELSASIDITSEWLLEYTLYETTDGESDAVEGGSR
ncbi:MAG: hypothetical protein H6831_12195 [Planctomycetes bacterium]|nr:hypothetical protein [Planctomycetota bacterium]MCB9905163.1 hypothetical protein [Planctomycetota bacterium]